MQTQSELFLPPSIPVQTTIVESTHRHRSVRLNVALICSEWEALRRRELGRRLISAGETTVTASAPKEDAVIPVPNPDFDYSLPSLAEDEDPEENNPDDSNQLPTPNPDFDYSLPSSVAAAGPPSEDSPPDNFNPFPTPNPDFDYSLPSLP